MKKHLLALFVLLLGVAPVLSSCSDDDDDNTPAIINNTKYGETEFALTSGIVETFGVYNDNVANFDISLMSYGVSYDDFEDEFNGNGYVLYMEMWSSSESDIAPGTYTYTYINNSDDYTANTFTNLKLYNNDSYHYFYEGTIVVSKVGNIYTIVVDGVDENDKTIKATYVGTLSFFNRVSAN